MTVFTSEKRQFHFYIHITKRTSNVCDLIKFCRYGPKTPDIIVWNLKFFNNANIKRWIAVFIELFKSTADAVNHARTKEIPYNLVKYI